MYIKDIVNITSRAWAAPILTSLHDGVPGRQASLLSATGAGRTAFVQSMDHLIELGLVERNPGFGHPLRPEFRLTKDGMKVAEMMTKVYANVHPTQGFILRRSWTLPVLSTLQTPKRFNEIKGLLGTITSRALVQSLTALEEIRWVDRIIDLSTRSPTIFYRSANAGKQISDTTGSELGLS